MLNRVLFESPCWDPFRSCVWFVNVYLGELWVFRNEKSKLVRSFGKPLSSVSIASSRKLLLTMRDEFATYEPEQDRIEYLHSLCLSESLRINDCKVGPDGRLIFSIFQDGKPRPKCGCVGVFGYNTGPSVVLRDCFFTPNGIAPDVARDILWIADTGEKKIYRYTLSSFLGSRSENSLVPLGVLEIAVDGDARPDGGTVDSKGNYLVALLGGGAILKVDADTLEPQLIPLKTKNPTMCTFYGRRMSKIFVTCGLVEQADPSFVAHIQYPGYGQQSFLFNDGHGLYGKY